MAATGPLAGRTLLVTRPADQAEGLCASIEAAGGRAWRWPLLEIVPVGDAAPALALLNRDDWDWLVFVSANAVRCAAGLRAWTRRGSGSTRIAAVGAATAQALAETGMRVDLIPKPQFNSESLLAAPEFAQVLGKRILIVRGAGGREWLARTLAERGAETAYAEVYQRCRSQADPACLVEAWNEGGVDMALATSGEALAHLMDLLGEAGPALADQTPLAVIGGRIAQQARERGWRRVVVAEPASDDGIMAAIIGFYREGGIRRDPPGLP
ncbi:uroporphyrinogen-III synthase [Methylomagnum ishizawai]|uniref:uroporphyrinogen-III synthase n=1 Tax=Methylomagnum ishizawai TaxID=1760988 RepID=UPI001C33E057|nr:uroporphyrinogen-III synthase [Methylomagnum ishizawai]BBL76942.1 uroporphyrinogen-III synthase [Methylomagnum ishizawai]